MDHTTLVNTFYNGFKNCDYQAMKAAYHSDVQFSDPVFIGLKYDEACAMWKMLCTRAKEFKLNFEILEMKDDSAVVNWQADYLYSKTNRTVSNVVISELVFKDGKIVQHTDDFDLWKWSAMALGPAGLALGWTPFLQKKIRSEGRKQLSLFMNK